MPFHRYTPPSYLCSLQVHLTVPDLSCFDWRKRRESSDLLQGFGSRMAAAGASSSWWASFASAFDWEKRDVRSDGWIPMSSVWPTISACVAYVVVVKVGEGDIF